MWFRRLVGNLSVVIGALVGACVLGLSVPATGIAKTGSPTLSRIEAVELFSTRAVVSADLCANGFSTSYSMEYALDTQTGLQWRTFAEGTVQPAGEGQINECGATEDLSRLLPETAYDIRIIGHNEFGSAIAEGQFSTPPVEPPEILHFGIEKEGEVGPDFANIELEVEDNGALSSCYEVKLKSGSGTVLDGTGCVSREEDVARRVIHIDSLSSGVEYTVLVTASNEAGASIVREYAFKTKPALPEVSCCSVDDISATGAHLSGVVVPDGSDTLWWLEVASSASASDAEWHAVAEGQFVGGEADSRFHPVAGDASGLTEAKTYYVRLVAENAHGKSLSSVRSFETAGRPIVMVTSVHGVHTTSGGDVVRGFGRVESHGYDTHVLFEYVSLKQWEASGWTEALSSVEEDAGTGEALGSRGFPSEIVGLDLPGVTVGEDYRVRLVGSSSQGTSVSAEQVLTLPVPEVSSVDCENETLRTGASNGLVDCRAYEQVTPSDKAGAMDIFKYGLVTASENVGVDGNRFMLHVPGVQWGSNPDAKQGDYVFSRSERGWSMRSLRPEGGAGALSYNTEVFNDDLTRVGVGAGWAPSQASTSTSIEYEQGAPGGPYTALGRPVARSKVGGAAFGKSGGIVAASGDFSKVVLQLEDHTFAGHSTGTSEGSDLYEVAGGVVRQVNVSSGGSTICAQGAQIASGKEAVTVWDQPQAGSPHAVSADGSRVFFTDNCAHHVYVRVDGKETVDIGAYAFVAADAQGDRVLLEKLVGGTREFFVYDSGTHVVSALAGFIVSGPIESMVVSEDFTAVYFNSTAALTPETSDPGEGVNIYRYDLANRALRFVVKANGGSREESVSPDGRFLFFGAGQGGASRFEGLPSKDQVYRYDNALAAIVCMSCASSFHPEPELKATFLGEPPLSKGADRVPSPFVASADGRFAFFDTPSALVPQDIDGEVPEEHLKKGGSAGEFTSNGYSLSSDVYEWRADGVDGCVLIGGCLSLVSGGTGGYLVQFLGTTPSGRDVFFASHEQLVSSDSDSAGDVFDARVNGGFAVSEPALTPCEGDACFSPVAAPFDTTPGSFAFVGPENPPVGRGKGVKRAVKRCGKGFVLRKRRCVRRRRVRRDGRARGADRVRGVFGGVK
jgi:hypothetical protein